MAVSQPVRDNIHITALDLVIVPLTPLVDQVCELAATVTVVQKEMDLYNIIYKSLTVSVFSSVPYFSSGRIHKFTRIWSKVF